MSDLEAQRRAYNAWGKNDYVPRSPGGGNPITPALRDLANYHDEFAKDVLALLDAGERWFTAYKIRQKPVALEPLVDAGVITIHKSTKHDGHYYKTTYITRPFCLTALALRDERIAALKKRTEGG